MLYGLALDIGGAISALPDNPFKITNLGVFISSAFGAGMILAAIACLLYLLWGGADWIISGGDKTAIENARNKITHAIVGLAIVVAIWALFGLVQYFLGINITGGNASNGNNRLVQTAGYGNGTYNCPGPHCDRCPGSSGPVVKVPCNSEMWNRNAECAVLFPAASAGCTKN
ncbi:MAG: pilin [Patescibacteria group bacterium]|nr:pilin [Patescibacteria group bacterium]